MNTDHQLGLLLSCSLPNLKPEYEIETIHIPAVENIITLVCVQLNIYRQYLFIKDRKPKRVYARQLVMYFLSTVENLSPSEIGEVLDLKDRSIQHGLAQLRGYLDVYDNVRSDVSAIINLLNPVEAVKLAS
jgi:chromosomal replication initiation ATPase DnaA